MVKDSKERNFMETQNEEGGVTVTMVSLRV